MKAYLVAGLGFGDEGKGVIVDALIRKIGNAASCVVRYNGGAQAAHHVTHNGHTHCFSQFGAGTLAGATTSYLSQFMVVDPFALEREAQGLQTLGILRPFDNLQIHPDALIVTPWHRILNRIHETARGVGRHGSCGRGIGEVKREAALGLPMITMSDLKNNWSQLVEKASTVRHRLFCGIESLGLLTSNLEDLDAVMWSEEAWRIGKLINTDPWRPDWYDTLIFEGAQGVLLDETYGFAPHTTWGSTTFSQADHILTTECSEREIIKIGVTRSFLTRHGAGPLPTEYAFSQPYIGGDHNAENPWQGALRVGCLDAMLLHYAIDVCDGIDQLAVTHCDKITSGWKVCSRYDDNRILPIIPTSYSEKIDTRLINVQPLFRRLTNIIDFMPWLENRVNVKVGIESHGRSADYIRWRKAPCQTTNFRCRKAQ